MSIINILITIFLPPLAVFLKHGLGGAFILNLLLTLLGWLPGVVHAFYVMNKR